MRSLISIFILVFAFALFRCSNQPVQIGDGGGTETVIGILVNTGGSGMSGAEVTIIPSGYNPVKGGELPDSMTTFTDAKGQYVFSPIAPGTYNILASHRVSNSKLFNLGVAVTEDTTFLSADTLKSPGALNIILPDTVDTAKGYIFIGGTTIYRNVSEGRSLGDGLYSLIVDSIPAATFNKLYFTIDNNPNEPVQLKNTFTVSSLDTLLIEAFDYLVIIGSVIYENGVYASGVTVQVIPEDYQPLKGPKLSGTMTDTTNLNGVFTLKVAQKGKYNIQAKHPGLGLSLFQPGITIENDSVNLSALTLHERGAIKLIMPDTMNTSFGYTFIGGTNIYKKLSEGYSDTGFWVLMLDSVPAASYSALSYAIQSNSAGPIKLTDSFTITSGDRILLEAFVTWRHYTTSNSGLPSNIVLDIVEDSAGVKWFGTNVGAVSFDGLVWTTYNRNNTGLLSDTIMSITVNTDGTRWFGTAKGIAKYDGNLIQSFTTVNSPLPNDSVYEIAADRAGNIWVGTDYGVAKYDANANWEVYTPANSPLPHPEVYCIAFDRDGSKWIGTDGGGLAHFDDVNWTIYTSSNSSLPHGGIFSIAIDKGNNKWIGGSGGVAFHDGSNWDFYRVGPSNYDHTVSSIGIDVDGVKWFGSYQGGRLFKLDGTSITCYNTSTSIIDQEAYEMFSIFVDNSNTKWLSTTRRGIYLFGPLSP